MLRLGLLLLVAACTGSARTPAVALAPAAPVEPAYRARLVIEAGGRPTGWRDVEIFGVSPIARQQCADVVARLLARREGRVVRPCDRAPLPPLPLGDRWWLEGSEPYDSGELWISDFQTPEQVAAFGPPRAAVIRVLAAMPSHAACEAARVRAVEAIQAQATALCAEAGPCAVEPVTFKVVLQCRAIEPCWQERARARGEVSGAGGPELEVRPHRCVTGA